MPVNQGRYTPNEVLAVVSGDSSVSRQASSLTANRALVSDSNGKTASTSVTSTELGYVAGLTSSAQNQLNAKLAIADTNNIANSGRKIVQQMIFAPDAATATGDGKGYLHICPPLSSKNLVYCHARLIAPGGGSGTTDIQIARNRNGSIVDMLTTKITIDVNETGSDTAAAAYAINTSNDDVVDNDLLRIDVDAVAGTPGSGAIITLGFE